MKVKPDGPVYEVQFTSQLISVSDCVCVFVINRLLC